MEKKKKLQNMPGEVSVQAENMLTTNSVLLVAGQSEGGAS